MGLWQGWRSGVCADDEDLLGGHRGADWRQGRASVRVAAAAVGVGKQNRATSDLGQPVIGGVDQPCPYLVSARAKDRRGVGEKGKRGRHVFEGDPLRGQREGVAQRLPDLRTHLNTYAGEGDEGVVFIGPKGANTFASQSGATLRELMNRMGHSTTRAALIYQHTAMERDRAIADALGKLATEALNKQDQDGSGTLRARDGHGRSKWC